MTRRKCSNNNDNNYKQSKVFLSIFHVDDKCSLSSCLCIIFATDARIEKCFYEHMRTSYMDFLIKTSEIFHVSVLQELILHNNKHLCISSSRYDADVLSEEKIMM